MYRRKISILLCILWMVSLFWACSESEPLISAPKIVRKKITARRINQPVEQPQAEKKQGESQEPEEKLLAQGSKSEKKEIRPLDKKDESDQNILEGLDGEILEKTDSEKYVAANLSRKKDPFHALYKTEPPMPKTKPIVKKEVEKPVEDLPQMPQRRLTPLEKVALNQLKLVGIIRARTGTKALVEEASGKGYVVTKGTYVGLNSGRVIQILKDRIVVEERDSGQENTRTRELKFQREDYYEM